MPPKSEKKSIDSPNIKLKNRKENLSLFRGNKKTKAMWKHLWYTWRTSEYSAWEMRSMIDLLSNCSPNVDTNCLIP